MIPDGTSLTIEHVQDVAAIGVDDEDFRKRLRAFVVKDGDVDEDTLKAHVKGQLAGYKVPREVTLLDLRERILPYLLRIRDSWATPMLYVTHNVGEALASQQRLMKVVGGERLLVMQQGLKIAYVEQEPTFDPAMSVFDAVAAGMGEQATMLADYEALGPHVLGEDPRELLKLQQRMDAALNGHPYVKSGFDMACWDVLGKATGHPLCTLLGGRYGDDFVLYRAISQGAPEAMARRLIVEITSRVPITGRPSGCDPKTASEKRSWTSSCGVSSYIAISSSTTSRSAFISSPSKRGCSTMSAITSSAASRWASSTRAYTTVYSRPVAAFSSPPRPSKIWAISTVE